MNVPSIEIATSIKYGNYRELKLPAIMMAETINNKFELICEFINLPKNLQIKIRPIRNLLGRAWGYQSSNNSPGQYFVEINVRQTIEEFYDTILHELVHIEQFFEGRLQLGTVKDSFVWNKKQVPLLHTTDPSYVLLPWEVEANKRAKTLTSVVFK